MWSHWALSALLHIELLILAPFIFLSLQGESEGAREGLYPWLEEGSCRVVFLLPPVGGLE